MASRKIAAGVYVVSYIALLFCDKKYYTCNQRGKNTAYRCKVLHIMQRCSAVLELISIFGVYDLYAHLLSRLKGARSGETGNGKLIARGDASRVGGALRVECGREQRGTADGGKSLGLVHGHTSRS